MENTEYSQIISVSSVDSVAIYHDFDLSKCHSGQYPYYVLCTIIRRVSIKKGTDPFYFNTGGCHEETEK
jgi:hypothetical protein